MQPTRFQDAAWVWWCLVSSRALCCGTESSVACARFFVCTCCLLIFMRTSSYEFVPRHTTLPLTTLSRKSNRPSGNFTGGLIRKCCLQREPAHRPAHDENALRVVRAWIPGVTRSSVTSSVSLLSELFGVCYRSTRATRRVARWLARTPSNRAMSPIPCRRIRSGPLISRASAVPFI
jgi:hypothetical protein